MNNNILFPRRRRLFDRRDGLRITRGRGVVQMTRSQGGEPSLFFDLLLRICHDHAEQSTFESVVFIARLRIRGGGVFVSHRVNERRDHNRSPDASVIS